MNVDPALVADIAQLMNPLGAQHNTRSGAGNGLDELVRAESAAQNTMVQISERAQEMNALYERVQASGDSAALQGLRDYIAVAAGEFDRDALDNMIQMGTAAFADEQSEFFTTLLGNFQALNSEFGGGGLARNMLNEAGASFTDLGLGAAQAFATAADRILGAGVSETTQGTVSREDTLQQFISSWQGLRGSDLDDAQRLAQLRELSSGIMEFKETLDMRRFMTALEEEG